jgi:hypothetical protein
MNDRLPKTFKVAAVWALFLLSVLGFYNACQTNSVSLSGDQDASLDNFADKYAASHDASASGDLIASPIDQINLQTLNQYQLYVVMDLSVSVNAQYDQKQRDKILTDIINKIKADFVNNGFHTNLYFFGGDAQKVEAPDIANFSEAALKKYKQLVNENSTDIASTLFKINNEIRSGNTERNRENLVVIITDDVHSTPTKLAPEKIEELKKDFAATTKDNSASYYLLKYSGQPSQKIDITNFITNNLGAFFKKTDTSLEKVSREITGEVHARMYLHDLTTPPARSSISSEQNACLLDNVTYYSQGNEIFAGRLIMHYLGAGTDPEREAQMLKLYDRRQNVQYINFNLENKHSYFPVRLNINEIKFCGDESVNLKIVPIKHKGKDVKANDIILKPNENLVISVPVEVEYSRSSWNKWWNQAQPFFSFGEDMDSLNLTYNYEILTGRTVLDNKGFLTDFNTSKNAIKNLSEIKEDRILVKGNQITELNKKESYARAGLLQKSYVTSWFSPFFWLIASVLLAFYFSKSRPSLNGWVINKDDKSIIGTLAHNKPFPIGGDYEDPQGDVIITPFKYVINFFSPFQSKDILEVNFKYGAEILDEDEEIREGKQGRVYLHSNENIQARIYENIDLKIS